MTNKYGFIKSEVLPQDYIFGDAQLVADILQADGQWDTHLPVDEFQNQGFEVYACATFGTLNCIETLLNRRFAFTENYSDRYVAKMTNTDVIRGNDPQKIAEFIRKSGDVEEYEWPYDNTTFDNYYRTPPAPLNTSAKTFTSHYIFGHDYVPNDPKSMMDALKYSPLGMSVYAAQDWDADIVGPGEGRDNHWVCVYGYVEGQYWKLFDSYSNTRKKIAWTHQPVQVKRYHIDLAPQVTSFLQSLIAALLEALPFLKRLQSTPPSIQNDPVQPPKPVDPPKPPPKLLIPFCAAIQDYEGYFKGSRSYRNNNPGNLRFEAQPGTNGKDAQGFAIYTTYQAGWISLVTMISNAASGKSSVYQPSMTILQFFDKYAPSSDSNDPHAYALYVAKRIGVTAASFQIQQLL